jgi:rubrerythrin
MMFESQAYDLYGRLAHQEKDNTLKSFYLDMAQEERKHLDKLSGQLDNLLS